MTCSKSLPEDIEAQLDIEDYDLALARIQDPEGDPVSLEDVMKRLGFVDLIDPRAEREAAGLYRQSARRSE